jgi:hypothetical protein
MKSVSVFSRIVMLFLVAILSLGAVACGGGGMMGGGTSTLDEAKALSMKLNGKYDAIKTNLDMLKSNASSFGLIPPDVDMSAVDHEALVKLLTDCYNTPAAIVDSAKAATDGVTKDESNTLQSQANQVASCPGASAESIKGIAGAAPETTVNLLVSKVNTLDSMRKDIYLMPTQVQDLITEAATSLTDVATIMAKAEATHEAAKLNPLGDKAAAESEYNAIKAELDSVTAIAGKITNDFSTLPAEIPGIGAQLVTDLANFGKR